MREIVFDTETTGLDPKTGDRLVEIGCIELVNRVPTGRTFHAYFNPERSMPIEAEQVHGLSDAFLADKPCFREHVLEPLDRFALTDEEKKLFEAGKAQYTLICGACHQPNGQGLDGLAPPLVDSDWTTGSPERLARIVLHGVRGCCLVRQHHSCAALGGPLRDDGNLSGFSSQRCRTHQGMRAG